MADTAAWLPIHHHLVFSIPNAIPPIPLSLERSNTNLQILDACQLPSSEHQPALRTVLRASKKTSI